MDILEEVEEFFLTAFLADILSDKIQILTCLLFKWFFLIDSNISLYVDITDLKKKKKYSKPKASVFSFILKQKVSLLEHNIHLGILIYLERMQNKGGSIRASVPLTATVSLEALS